MNSNYKSKRILGDHYDVLAERSKALRSGRSLARGVGSNPTDVILGAAAQSLAQYSLHLGA